ncbi:DNA cytosine methyltransferase [Isoptericola halotolerans]|uniref:DNA cytosine methyltransferase n=1 Tax=Isoptericola halotolerans TaxID=300560 RepID=UPI0038906F18
MSHNLTMTDLFCGAGGSSTGAVEVGGVQVRLAANHWDRAIETHNSNHPDVDHLQADISNTDPRYVPRTDILWASPECTNHSRAKGRKAHRQPDLFGDVLPDEAAERSRATMWDVVRFTEAHGYRAVLVENVVEVVDWSSEWGVRGGLFQAWLAAMHAMGYRHRIVSLNSMHAQAHGAPAPQSRDRVYIAFWRQGERAPDFERMQRPRAYCPRCDTVVDAMQWWKRGDGQSRPGRYRQQYLYRCPNSSCRNTVVEPAWLPASSIIDWSNPGVRLGDRARPLAEKTMRRIRVGIERYWGPMLAEHGGNPYDAADPRHPRHGDPDSYYRVWPISDVTQTMHTRESKALAYHPKTVEPLVAELRGGGSTARPASSALSTVTASGNHHGLVVPYYGNGQAAPDGRPLPTVTTVDRHALIHRHNNNRGDQSAMTTPSSEPVRTITTAGHQSVLQADRPTLDLDDVRFRMLEPDEIKQAMAFPADYLMAGNRREQVKLSGNAVTPPAARDLVATVVEAITGEGGLLS